MQEARMAMTMTGLPSKGAPRAPSLRTPDPFVPAPCRARVGRCPEETDPSQARAEGGEQGCARSELGKLHPPPLAPETSAPVGKDCC